MPITDSHLSHLLRHGFVIIPSFLPAELVAAGRENMLRYFPTVEELESRPERFGFVQEDPEHLQVEFPFAGPVLNSITTHEDVLGVVEAALGSGEILLSQAAIWAKYAGTGDFEQGLHLDYQGNTLVVPRDDGDYRQVNMILYYTDVSLELGPTYVVSQEHTRELPLWPTHRTRKKNPELYQKERPVLARAGDLLVFSMRTWHRASAMTAERGVRFTHHMVWRSRKHPFQGYHMWSQKGEDPGLQEFIEHSTPRQREVLGFPAAGDPYWTAETVAATKLRYPSMDMSPYGRAAAPAGKGKGKKKG